MKFPLRYAAAAIAAALSPTAAQAENEGTAQSSIELADVIEVTAPTEPGAVIVDIVPDSPADQAGLRVEDVIVAVDDQELTWENNLADLIAAYEPGDEVTLEIKRSDEELQEVTVELGEHPDREGIAYLGVHAKIDYYGVFGGFPKISVLMALTGQKGVLEVAELFYGKRVWRFCSTEEAHQRAQTIEEALREVTGLLRSPGR